MTPETLHGVVAFTRSLNLGSRDNNAHFRCELPFVVQPQWKPDQVAAQAADTFYQCVAVVLQQAGLPFTISDDGVLHEVVQAFTGAKPVEQRAERQESSSGSSSRFPHPADMRRPEHISEGMWRDLCENYDDWYDNRADKASGEYAGQPRLQAQGRRQGPVDHALPPGRWRQPGRRRTCPLRWPSLRGLMARTLSFTEQLMVVQCWCGMHHAIPEGAVRLSAAPA